MRCYYQAKACSTLTGLALHSEWWRAMVWLHVSILVAEVLSILAHPWCAILHVRNHKYHSQAAVCLHTHSHSCTSSVSFPPPSLPFSFFVSKSVCFFPPYFWQVINSSWDISVLWNLPSKSHLAVTHENILSPPNFYAHGGLNVKPGSISILCTCVSPFL